MEGLCRQLLDKAVAGSAMLVRPLRNASILVTGASGFLASGLIAFLHAADTRYELRLRLFGTARRPLSQVPLFEFLGLRPRIKWSVSSVEDTVLPAVQDLIVVHAASHGSPRDYQRDPVGTFQANTAGLLHLFRQAGERSARSFIYYSSAEIYGQPPPGSIPTSEHYVGGGDPLECRSIYAESKRSAEALGACLARRTGIPFVALRPWNVYGPGQRLDDGRVPIEFLRQAQTEGHIRLLSNGSPQRAFCFTWDAQRQIAATLGLREPLRAFNIGNSTEEIRILDLARRCAEVAGADASRVDYDPDARTPGLQRCAPDTAAVQAILGQEIPFTPLDIGLVGLREWICHLQTHANPALR